MIYSFFCRSSHVLLALKAFVAVSLLVSSLQHIYNINKFSEAGLVPWSVIKKRKQFKYFRCTFFDMLYSRNGFLALNLIRIALLGVFAYTIGVISIWVLLPLTICTYLIFFRSTLMNNAADQVNNIILLNLILIYFFRSYASPALVICFLAGMLITSYFTSGLLKLHEPKWKNGYFLQQILMSRSYNNQFFYKIVNGVNLKTYRVLSVFMISWQIAGFLSPLLPIPLLFAYLFIGCCFHLLTGIFMGLNNFIWTFTGLLPTLIYLNFKVLHAI